MNIIATWKLMVLFMVLLQLALTADGAERVLFITGQPTGLSRDLKPLPFAVLKIEGDQLLPVWTSQSEQPVYYVDTYHRDSILMVSWGFPSTKEILLFKPSRMSEPQMISVDADKASISHYQLVASPAGAGHLRVCYSGDRRVGTPPTSKYFELRGSKEVASQSLSDEMSVRVSGALSPYVGAPSNGTLAVVLDDSLFRFERGELQLGLPPVSSDLLPAQSVRGWRLIANEEDFSAIVPLYEGESDDRRVLTCTRVGGVWRLLTLPSGTTMPCLVNGYLVGIIAHERPENDPEKSRGYPPLWSGEAVIISPPSNSQFTVTLGKECEVLWIENGDVYYRVGDKLYQARIEDDDFVDRQLLLTDPRVKHIHWAFSGAE